jgi:hypothetical protein
MGSVLSQAYRESDLDIEQSNNIRKRAIAFAESGEWCNAQIISESAADVDLVQRKGSGHLGDYREFRIEVDMRPEMHLRAIQLATKEDKSELAAFLAGKWTMDITCSKTDIIDVKWPFVD